MPQGLAVPDSRISPMGYGYADGGSVGDLMLNYHPILNYADGGPVDDNTVSPQLLHLLAYLHSSGNATDQEQQKLDEFEQPSDASLYARGGILRRGFRKAPLMAMPNTAGAPRVEQMGPAGGMANGGYLRYCAGGAR